MPHPRRSAAVDDDDALALRLVALLNDDQVLAKMRNVLFPQDLANKLDSLTAKVDSLTKELTNKDEKLDILEKKIQTLEEEVDCQEQYSRRPNLRIQGMPEETDGTTEQKVLLLINETIGFTPPLALTDLERAHRIGPAKDKEGRPRKRHTIVRFRSERLRDSVFRSRSNLKEYNQGHPDATIFMNEDLTAHRASLAFNTRLLKRQQKINDCWTTGGKVVIKDLSNQIRQITSSVDLDKY